MLQPSLRQWTPISAAAARATASSPSASRLPPDHDTITARSRRDHDAITTRSRHDHGAITARSRRGHGGFRSTRAGHGDAASSQPWPTASAPPPLLSLPPRPLPPPSSTPSPPGPRALPRFRHPRAYPHLGFDQDPGQGTPSIRQQIGRERGERQGEKEREG